MKNVTKLLFITLTPLLMASCQEKSTSNNSSNTNQYNTICTTNWYAPGCPGATTGGTTGTGTVDCYSGNTYWTSNACYGYSLCMSNPRVHTACPNYNGTPGGTTGGTTNPYPNSPSSPVSQYWGMHYKPNNTPPSGSCSETFAPSGINFTPYETRKATVSIAGGTFYDPSSYLASRYMNTSSILKTTSSAKTLFETDSMLKVRFKVRPQPENNATNPYCYIENYNKGFSISGYTKLKFNVELVGQRGSFIGREPLGEFTAGVNSCTEGIDLSRYASQYPDGIYLVVGSVMSNQRGYPADYDYNGFTNHNVFDNVRSMDCWVLDIEVAADGTKTFN